LFSTYACIIFFNHLFHFFMLYITSVKTMPRKAYNIHIILNTDFFVSLYRNTYILLNYSEHFIFFGRYGQIISIFQTFIHFQHFDHNSKTRIFSEVRLRPWHCNRFLLSKNLWLQNTNEIYGLFSRK